MHTTACYFIMKYIAGTFQFHGSLFTCQLVHTLACTDVVVDYLLHTHTSKRVDLHVAKAYMTHNL